MSDDLVKRLTNPTVPYDPEVDAQGFWDGLCGEAKTRIEALTVDLANTRRELGEMFVKALDFDERAEAAEADSARLRAACTPLAIMDIMDDRAPDDTVCVVSAKTVKAIRAALNTGKEVMPPVPVSDATNTPEVGPGDQGAVAGAEPVQTQIKPFDCECGEVGPCKAAFCTPRSTMEPSHE